ncbi:hypothetical protein niasHT_024868 [Heterodera trifolii]|uniref:Ubiquitin-like domain-containing protein n=1 Tax=Heterodera trifolii TaxID=157864 RepID=A0ABD2JG82_9BILA
MLKGEDTVADVKSKIAEEMKIEPERITLRHKSEFEPPLEDSKIVKDYGIEKYSPIYLTLDEYEIFVHFNEQNYPIWVRKKDNVETLNKRVKRMLNKEFRIGFENIIPLKECDSAVCHMFMINRQTMKQERIIKDKVIYVDCELFLLELAIFDIFIEYKKKKYQVQVKGADTVLDLKTKIGNIQEIGILPNQQQKLICQKADGDEVLEDDSSIAYCKIAKNSTVFLTIAEMEQQEEKPSSSSKRQGEKKPSSSKKKKTAH